jgi:hypothetical protein
LKAGKTGPIKRKFFISFFDYFLFAIIQFSNQKNSQVEKILRGALFALLAPPPPSYAFVHTTKARFWDFSFACYCDSNVAGPQSAVLRVPHRTSEADLFCGGKQFLEVLTR